MSKAYALSKQRSQKELGNRSKRVELAGNGRMELVQRRAYEIYQERIRNNMPGDQMSDWVKAEQEIKSLT